MKLLVLFLSLAILLCGCGSGNSEAIDEPDIPAATEATAPEPEPELAPDFAYYRGVAGTSSENDNIFICPYADSFLCLNYDFRGGYYEEICGMVLTQEEKAAFLELLETEIIPTERDDSDEAGGEFREFAICFGGEEQIIEAFDLSFLNFKKLDEVYSYRSREDSYDEAMDAFDISQETKEKLGRWGEEFILPGNAVTVFIANQIVDRTGEMIDSAEEISADEAHFRLQVDLENDEELLLTVTYTGLIVEWEYN